MKNIWIEGSWKDGRPDFPENMPEFVFLCLITPWSPESDPESKLPPRTYISPFSSSSLDTYLRSNYACHAARIPNYVPNRWFWRKIPTPKPPVLPVPPETK